MEIKNKKIFGSHTFFHIYTYVEPDVIESNKKIGLFGKKQKNEKEQLKETNDQIWIRINDFIQEKKITVINFEAIYKYNFRGGGEFTYSVSIINDNVVGYRLYYRHK